MTDMATTFWMDGRQAVQLPEAFRLADGELRVSRREDGAVVLEPMASLSGGDPAGAAAAVIDRLRAAIRDGVASGASERWDVEEVKRLARKS